MDAARAEICLAITRMRAMENMVEKLRGGRRKAGAIAGESQPNPRMAVVRGKFYLSDKILLKLYCGWNIGVGDFKELLHHAEYR